MVDHNQYKTFSFQHLSHLVPLTSSMWSIMSGFNTSCTDNCSGHGDCYNGICFCEVKYSGGSCTDPNLSYYIAFSSVFYMICAVSLIQLILCIKAEYTKMKPPSLVKACHVTTQKALYLLICIATAIRGFYFSSPENAAMQWTSSLLSAYYPILLSGSSLVVCFWAEMFHLRDLSFEKPGFLSKSFLGFVAFNIITYSLLLAELLLLQFSTVTDKHLFTSIFHGCYAFLMLIVVIFFLIYGVEVFFKVRGGFTEDSSAPVDISQLHQSRIGLVSQAFLLLVTIAFILSDIFGSLWKYKVAVISRNCYDIIFRIVELGVALWFPCVLWNCVRPEQLWILNPRKILRKLENIKKTQPSEAEALVSSGKAPKSDITTLSEKIPECWICYDTERTDAGILLQPCNCKGDVSAVHHECLKKWLIESSSHPDNIKCKVCNEQYQLERSTVWLHSGLTPVHWLKTTVILTVMCSSSAGAFLIVKIFTNVVVRTLSVGSSVLVVYICLRLLGFSFLKGYQRAKFSAVKILGQKFTPAKQDISQTTARENLLNDSQEQEQVVILRTPSVSLVSSDYAPVHSPIRS